MAAPVDFGIGGLLWRALVNVAVVFRDFWDDRPRPSKWIVGRGRATLVRKDEFGKLWRLRPGSGGESVRVVEVVN